MFKKIETLKWDRYHDSDQPYMEPRVEIDYYFFGLKIWTSNRMPSSAEIMEKWS